MGFAFLAAFLVLTASVWSSVSGKLVQKGSCDLFQGSWVFDNSSYPLYESSSQCPFIERQFDCKKNGRPDNEYTKYRWQPSGCILPSVTIPYTLKLRQTGRESEKAMKKVYEFCTAEMRFNGVEFVRKLKDKQLMFVGDSLSLNQWQSLTCILHTAVPQAKYTTSRTLNGLSTFTFPQYNATIMFYRNAFIVDIRSESRGRVMRLDSISSSTIWGRMDFLIFDTWHWWLHNGRKQAWDWIVYGNTTVRDMDRLEAYELALNTWAKWVDSNVDPAKTQVFFQGVSPDHDSGQGSETKNCVGQTKPLKGPAGSPLPAEMVLEKVLRTMDKPVYLLNVTTLSQLRIDGHPSVYGHGGHRDMDCTHWCLSGVPDTWNQFLLAMLI